MKCGAANIKHEIALNTMPQAIHLVRFRCPQKYANTSDSIICDTSLPLKITPETHEIKSIHLLLDIFGILENENCTTHWTTQCDQRSTESMRKTLTGCFAWYFKAFLKRCHG